MSGIVFFPLCKVDLEKHEVWGVAADAVPDKTGEVMDYPTSKPNFQKWSDEIFKSSGGKSLGNIRAMHGGVAAGKLTAITFDDDALKVMVGAKIIDMIEWEKVVAGVYTGFSVGGDYGKRWDDPDITGVTRYTAIPHEISLVDNPAMYGATFDLVRGAGLQKVAFVGGLQKLVDLEGELETTRMAFYDTFQTEDAGAVWIERVFDEHIIAHIDGQLVQIPYTKAVDGTISFSDPVEVRVEYVPIASPAAEDDLPEVDLAEVDNETTEEELIRFVAAMTASVIWGDLVKRVDALTASLTKTNVDATTQAGRLEKLEGLPRQTLRPIAVIPPVAKRAAPDMARILELRRKVVLENNPGTRAHYRAELKKLEAAL